MRKYILLAVVSTLFFACKKEDVPTYSGPAGFGFYTSDADSIIYSFAFSALGTGIELQEDTVWLDMRALGLASDSPRAIKLRAAEGTTAREGIDFKLPDVMLPAGELIMQYPFVVYNTDEMKSEIFRVVLEVVPTEDFELGAIGTPRGTGRGLNSFKVLITNILDQPTWWNQGVINIFGEYSEAKYRFMMATMNMTDFSTEAIGWYGPYNYPIMLRKALEEYEAVHGPLIDEATGQRVEF